MALYRYILKRLLEGIPVFLFVTAIIFILMRLTGGDPAQIMLGPRGTEAAAEALRQKWGLNEPLYMQYFYWLSNILVLDFGTDFNSGRPVAYLIAGRFPITVALAFFAMIISLSIALPAGIISAINQNTPTDYGAVVFALIGVSMPNFWLGLMLIIVFGLHVGWLPTHGYHSLLADPINGIRHLILPAIALGTALAAVVTRMLRSSMLEVMSEDYIRTARAKGMSENTVIYKHALRNALIPTVTVIGLQIAYLMNGSILVETVFAIPGMGRLLVDAVFQRNYPVIQGVVVVLAVVFILVNMVVDIIYTYLDPQISYE